MTSSDAELQTYRAMFAREQEVARSIFSSLLRIESLASTPRLRWHLGQDAFFHGDLVLAAKPPGGGLHLLIGDFPGRGLAASIGAMPTAEVFHAMTDKGFELIDIVLELNQRLRRLLPSNLFLACCLIAIDASGQGAQVWAGGLPPLLIHRQALASWERLDSPHLPLGILPSERLNRAMELVKLEPEDRLLLYTNGLLERLGQPLLAWIEQQAQIEVGQLFDRLIAEQGDATAFGQTQVTLLEFQAGQPLSHHPAVTNTRLLGKGIKAEWRYELHLDARGLRGFDPRPMLTQLLVEVQGLQEHRERIYTLIAELYSNALEHGLLGLDSGLKSSPEGFAHYYMERESRLATLDQGQISFYLSHSPQPDGGILGVEVQDSGPGFNYQKQDLGALNAHGYSGRGLGIVRSLAKTLEYFPPGNRVRISYHWQHFQSGRSSNGSECS